MCRVVTSSKFAILPISIRARGGEWELYNTKVENLDSYIFCYNRYNMLMHTKVFNWFETSLLSHLPAKEKCGSR